MTPTLDLLLRELRAELDDAKWFRFHSRAVPTSTEAIQISRWDVQAQRWQPNWDEVVEVLDAGAGPSLSKSAELFLEGKGVNALPQRSIAEIGWFCHARHGTHCEQDGCLSEGLPARTPLCERIVAALVELRQPLGQVAWREERSEEETHGLAVQGLRRARAWKHRQLHAYMRSATERERDSRVTCPLCEGRPIRMRRRSAA